MTHIHHPPLTLLWFTPPSTLNSFLCFSRAKPFTTGILQDYFCGCLSFPFHQTQTPWEILPNYPYQCLRNTTQGPVSPESKSSKPKYLRGRAIWRWSSNSIGTKLNPKVNRDKKESFLQNLLLYPTVPILVHSIHPQSCLPFSGQHWPALILKELTRTRGNNYTDGSNTTGQVLQKREAQNTTTALRTRTAESNPLTG